MIKLTKGAVPQVILEHGAAWTSVWVDHVENGTVISEADKGRYRHPQIKSAIVQETAEKCAYCESKVTHTYPGDVEHLLPKRRRPDLFVEWPNLTLGCSVCNNRKGDYYSEEEPLVNPYVDNPAEHIVFHGPLAFHVSGSARGERTSRRLGLSRTPLVERRSERVTSLKPLIDRWAEQDEGELKDLLLAAIREELADEQEYAAALRAFAREHVGIVVG